MLPEDLTVEEAAAYLVERLGQDGAAKALGMEAVMWSDSNEWHGTPPQHSFMALYAFPPSEAS